MASHLDRTFAALADPTRRRVVELLRARPRRAGELAAAVKATPPAMSRHLRVLRAAGVVAEESPDEDARVRVYTLKKKPFEELEAWLDEVAAFWTDQLQGFAEHVERRAKKGKGS